MGFIPGYCIVVGGKGHFGVLLGLDGWVYFCVFCMPTLVVWERFSSSVRHFPVFSEPFLGVFIAWCIHSTQH